MGIADGIVGSSATVKCSVLRVVLKRRGGWISLRGFSASAKPELPANVWDRGGAWVTLSIPARASRDPAW